MKRIRVPVSGLAALVALVFLTAVPAEAQLNGSHTLGDFGVQSGTQPSPGFYAALFYYRYDTDTIKNRDVKVGQLVGARLKTQGDTLAITATFPVPSVKLK